MPNRGVESTCGIPSAPIEILRALGRLSPWTWIGSVFVAQVAGSLVVSHALGLSASDVALPIGVLLAGAAIAFILRALDPGDKLGVWKWWLPAIIYGTFIFLLSNRSFEVSSVSFSGNYFHPLEYMTLGFLACMAWQPLLKRNSMMTLFSAVMISGILFAISDEVHQHFIPGRRMDLVDLSLDALGLWVGFGAFLLLQWTRRMVAGP